MSEDKIKKIQEELLLKDRELDRYRTEISKLNSQLRGLIDQISSEIKVAQNLQKALVPTTIPNIHGFDFSTKYVPSFEHGGDYFDIFEHDDKMRFGILMSNSSGHGMSALFLTVLMKMAKGLEARKVSYPHEAIQALMDELAPNMQSHDHADLFYATIDRRSFELKYSLVGAIRAYVVRAGTEVIHQLSPQAPSLTRAGMRIDESGVFHLNAKDRFVVVSRGVSEAKNKNGVTFESKLLDILEAKLDSEVHEIRNEILHSLERFTGTSDPKRDLTVLIADVKERVLKLARN